MKICFFLSDITKVGGIERVTATLVSKLALYPDLSIDIVSMFKGRDEPNYSIPDCVSIRYLLQKKHGAKPHSMKRALNMFSNLFAVRKYFRESDYDLVIAQAFPIAAVLFLSGFPSRRIIAVEHVYAGYYNNVLQQVRRHIYRKLYKVVVLTSADKSFLDRQLPESLTCVIPNPVRKIEAEYAPLENKRLISVGRLEYEKGYDNLIDGIAVLHEKFPDWRLDIYGDGSQREMLQQKISALGLESVVTLCGLTNDIDSKLQASSIFVMSSHFEGFGMVLVEAMSHGVPCISYDCPNGPSTIIKHGYNGLLIENQNLDALIDAIATLIENVEERKRLGLNGPGSIVHFSEEIVAQKWYDLIRSVN